jgi:hypothetical protein
LSRWTKQVQQGYTHKDFPLAKGGSSNPLASLGPSVKTMKTMASFKLPGGGVGSSAASAGEPRIVLELEFLPYW